MCSGSEGCHFVFAAMQKTYAAAGGAGQWRQAFACELAPAKRQWIRSLLAAEGQGHVCVFHDVTDMRSEFALCDTHGKRCRVPPVDVLVAGTSCKDLSRMLSQPARIAPLLGQVATRGGSAQTFRAVLSYVEQQGPTAVVFENVDSLADDVVSKTDASSMDVLLAEMASRGYEGQALLTDASEFGLPARRRRYYVVFVKATSLSAVDFSSRSVDDTFATLRKLVSACVRQAPCASRLLLPDTAAPVQRELAQRLAAGPRASAASASAEWPALQMREYRGRALRWGQGPDGASASSPWYPTLNPRERGTLVYSLAVHPDRLLHNISQQIHRVPVSALVDGRHVAPTQMPGQLVWVCAAGSQPRLLLGREALLLQGFPVGRTQALADSVAESFLQDLAGNAMALPVVLAVLMATVAAVSWKSGRVVGELEASAEEPSCRQPAAALVSQLLRLRQGSGSNRRALERGHDCRRRVPELPLRTKTCEVRWASGRACHAATFTGRLRERCVGVFIGLQAEFDIESSPVEALLLPGVALTS
jgi:site-specific DNA-cytosine methylase